MTSISQSFQTAKNYILKHKIISGIVLIIILYGGYWMYTDATNTSGQTRYVTATVGTDTVISTVTGTGQVSASNQINVTPQASGNITYVGVTAGQQVAAGATIADIDSTDAQKTVRNAELSLQSAQLSLAKLQEPATPETLSQTQDAVTQAQSDLQTAYTSAGSSISSTFLDLPTIMTGLQNILYGSTVSKSQDNISAYYDLISPYVATSSSIRDAVAATYTTAQNSYNGSFSDYQMFSPAGAATSTISNLLQETYTTTGTISDSVKSTNDYLNFVKNTLTLYNKPIPQTLTTAQNTLSTYITEINSDSSSLLNDINTITTSNESIVEKTQSLAQLQQGTDPLDIQSSQLNVTQAQNALQDAKDALADYYVTAPFAGTIADINVQVGDSVGSGTTVATLISPQQIADVSLNEVDVAKIKLGDKAELTFDAISGLTITGEVSEIDAVGTVSQGVVTYNVKITFDTQDPRILPGMSTSASIITQVDPNVIVVPNSALKTQGGTTYVQVFNPPLSATTTANATASQGVVSAVPPTAQVVTVGLANNTETEITSGLNQGDQIVTRTIAPTTATASTAAAPSILSATGVRSGATGGAAAGGAFRAGAGAGAAPAAGR